ncbi:MAG TPA: hypothetical protein VGF73_02155 [Chthoniobacterales bacterium]|jgi:hypothetical protein
MKKILCLVATCCLLLSARPLWAGTETDEKATVATTQSTGEAVPLDLFKIESGYVFESDLNHGGSFGKQSEIQNEFEYGHRIQLHGNFYAHLGISYDRYDFGSTGAPVPNHLQALAGVFGVDYMHGKDVGAFFQVRPGFYFQNDVGISSFDIPITLGRIFVVKEDKLYIFGGAYASFLRSGFPVLPLAGVIWIVSDDVRLMAVLPEPKLIYSPNKKLDLWVGGELVGGSFRTDRNENILPKKLNGTQIDFSEYRAGVGLTYAVCKDLSLDLGAGVSIERQFDFGRAGETYRTDPSPYVRLQMSASF